MRPTLAAAKAGMTPEEWLIVCVIKQAVNDLCGPDEYWRQDAIQYLSGPLFIHDCGCIGVEADAFLKHSGVAATLERFMMDTKQLVEQLVIDDTTGLKCPVYKVHPNTLRIWTPKAVEVEWGEGVNNPTEQDVEKIEIVLERHVADNGTAVRFAYGPEPDSALFYCHSD